MIPRFQSEKRDSFESFQTGAWPAFRISRGAKIPPRSLQASGACRSATCFAENVSPKFISTATRQWPGPLHAGAERADNRRGLGDETSRLVPRPCKKGFFTPFARDRLDGNSRSSNSFRGKYYSVATFLLVHSIFFFLSLCFDFTWRCSRKKSTCSCFSRKINEGRNRHFLKFNVS